MGEVDNEKHEASSGRILTSIVVIIAVVATALAFPEVRNHPAMTYTWAAVDAAIVGMVGPRVLPRVAKKIRHVERKGLAIERAAKKPKAEQDDRVAQDTHEAINRLLDKECRTRQRTEPNLKCLGAGDVGSQRVDPGTTYRKRRK